MTKCEEKLKALQKSLFAWVLGKKKGKSTTKGQLQETVAEILSDQYMKDLFTVDLNFDEMTNIKYSVDRNALERITKTRLGRMILLTNCNELLIDEVVRCYRELAHIEEALKHIKNRDYFRWQPAFH